VAAASEQSEPSVGSAAGAATATAGAATAVALAPAKVGLAQYITAETVGVELTATERDAAIAELVDSPPAPGRSTIRPPWSPARWPARPP
jgi:hypothetical protein